MLLRQEQYRERAYFSQEMKVSKYELYREDWASSRNI